jgi:hypothetical protein
MRGDDNQQEGTFSYVSPEKFRVVAMWFTFCCCSGADSTS